MQLGNYEAINPTDVPVISETAMPGSFVISSAYQLRSKYQFVWTGHHGVLIEEIR